MKVFALFLGIFPFATSLVSSLQYEYWLLENFGVENHCLNQLNDIDLTLSPCDASSGTQNVGPEINVDYGKQYGTIQFLEGNKVLDVAQMIKSAGAKVIQYGYKTENNANQMWKTKKCAEDGYYLLVNLNSQRCLAANMVNPNAPKIIQDNCNITNPYQQWYFGNAEYSSYPPPEFS